MSRTIVYGEPYSVGMVVPKVNSKGKVIGKGLFQIKCFKKSADNKSKSEKYAKQNKGKEMVKTGRFYTKIEGKLKVVKGC
ncbi:MAG: hypothetical protein AABY22_13275 [Nanoarchaeota archaeon]